jgi:hypothetical protein
VPYSLILDLLVAALLATTIVFAVVLNGRLGKLRGDRKALEKLAAAFGESTLRAEHGIKTLQQTTDVLQQNLDKAEALKEDLAFLIERGDRAADKLEDLVRATRDTAAAPETQLRPESQPQPEPAAAVDEEPSLTATRETSGPVDEDEDDGRSEAERELLKAIRSAG